MKSSTPVIKIRGWHSAFSSTMEAYEKAIGRSACGQGLRSQGYSIGVCQPQVSDFIADVQITARRVLNPTDYKFFQSVYIDFVMVDRHTERSETYTQTHTRISKLLGRAFIARGIFPAGNYYRKVDKRK